MEATIFKTALFFHVISGFLGLTTGLVAMLSKKGSKLHNRLGIVFYWAMTVIFVTTVLFVIIYPNKIIYQFFLGVGIVSFYPNWSGKRVLLMKKNFAPTWLDKAMAVVIGIVGVAMIAYTFTLDSSKNSDYQLIKILFYFFGIVCFVNSYGDVSVYFGFKKPEKLHWLFAHGGKMLGSYTAAVTAFSVNIIPRYLPKDLPGNIQLLIWMTPIVTFSILGQVILKRYRKKVLA